MWTMLPRDTSRALIVAPALRDAYVNDTFSMFGRRFKARLSPRLGISHPVSDNQTLFFSVRSLFEVAAACMCIQNSPDVGAVIASRR